MPLSFIPSGSGTASTGVATIPGGVTDNFVSIANDDTLKDSGKSAGSFLTANTTIATGTYTKISYDAKGLVTGGTSLVVDDIPDIPFTKLTDTPTTLAGYGITDGGSVDINGLPEETMPVGGDYFPMYDDTAGANRKVSFTNIQSSINYPVDSVNTKTGAVTLDADDISDTTTTNKFVTSAEKSTWDSKLSAVATATTGNFAGLNAGGVLIDSGSKAADFATAGHNHDSAYETAGAVSTHESTYNHSSFITSSAVTYENLSANGDIGTGSSQVAAGDHNHTGTYEPADAGIQSHISAVTGNPHAVTKTDVGLGNVDNTSDANKPVSTATQSALDNKSDTTHNHTGTYEPAGSVSTHESTYNHSTFITASGVTYENLNSNGDVGTGSSQVAVGNHTHAASNISDFDTEVGNNTTVTGKLDKAGGAMTGTLATVTDAQVRNIKLSTSDPTSGDGSNGDVWIKYTS